MSDAIENAAAAFDTAMGRAPAPAGRPAASQKAAPEPVFNNMGVLDDDSDEAGGDDEPAPKVKAKKEVNPEDLSDAELDALLGDGGEGDPEGEGDEGDSEEGDGEGEEEDAGDDDELLAREFEVLVDGEPKKVTLKEALHGYMRQDTFHRRLNQIDEARKVITAEAQKVVQSRQQYLDMLGEAEDVLKSLIPTDPDWDALYAEDPVKARALQKQYDGYKARVQEVRTKREEAAKKAAEDDARETAEFARSEFPKFARFAGWRTREEMSKDVSSMRRTAMTLGFSEEEVASVYDSRMLGILLKASKYDRMMAARPKPVNTGKKPSTPGAGRNRTAPKGLNKAQANLNRTGSVEDAAAVFAKMISQ